MSNTHTEQEVSDSLKAFEQAFRIGNRVGVQYRKDSGDWFDCDESNYFWLNTAYRIKPAPPTPKLRAWKPEEVPVGALVRNKGKSDMGRWLIISLTSAGITTAGNQQSSSALQTRSEQWYLETCEYSIDGGKTWKSCGVLE